MSDSRQKKSSPRTAKKTTVSSAASHSSRVTASASLQWRASALLIDGLILVFVVYLLSTWTLWQSSWIIPNLKQVAVTWVFLLFVWQWLWLLIMSHTPGQYLFSLTIVDQKSGQIASLKQRLQHHFLFWLFLFPGGLGLFVMLSRQDNRGWHEFLSRSSVQAPVGGAPLPWFVRSIGKAGRWVLIFLTTFAMAGWFYRSSFLPLLQQSVQPNICDNEKVMARPSRFAVARLISPTPSSCWQKTLQPVELFGDSKNYQFLKYIHSQAPVVGQRLLSEGPTKTLIDFQKAPACRSQGSKGAGLCSLVAWLKNAKKNAPSSKDIEEAEVPVEQLVLEKLFHAESHAERIGEISQILYFVRSPILRLALQERFWMEERSLAKISQPLPSWSFDSDWLRRQRCWYNALTETTIYSCSHPLILEGVQTLRQLDREELSFADAEAILVERPDLPRTIIESIQLWIAIQNQNPLRVQLLRKKIDNLSPTHSFNQKWLNAYLGES